MFLNLWSITHYQLVQYALLEALLITHFGTLFFWFQANSYYQLVHMEVMINFYYPKCLKFSLKFQLYPMKHFSMPLPILPITHYLTFIFTQSPTFILWNPSNYKSFKIWAQYILPPYIHLPLYQKSLKIWLLSAHWHTLIFVHFYCIGCDSYFCDLFYIQTGPFHEFSAPFPLCVEKWEWRVSKCSCIYTSAVLFGENAYKNLCTMWVFYLPGLFTMELNQQMWFDKKVWQYSILEIRPFLDPEQSSEGIYFYIEYATRSKRILTTY